MSIDSINNCSHTCPLIRNQIPPDAHTDWRGSSDRAGAAAVLVFLQQRHPGEGLGAVTAAVLLDVRVGLQVRPQVGPVGEGASAVGAGEGLLARVRPEVALQQPGPGEGLAAHAALARQGVRPDVHLERAQGHVGLVAVLAAELLLDLRGAVELLVLGQPREGGVALAARLALVPHRLVLGARRLQRAGVQTERGGSPTRIVRQLPQVQGPSHRLGGRGPWRRAGG